MDDDAVLAAKVFIHKHPNSVHLSASRKARDIPKGEPIIFIKPYGDTILEYLGRNPVTLLQYEQTELYSKKDILTEKGCVCHWLDHNESCCTYMWSLCHDNFEYPDVIRFTHDYVKWELRYEDSIMFHYGMSIVPRKLTTETTSLYLQLIDGDESLLRHILRDGEHIRRYVDHTQEQLYKELTFSSSLSKYSTICANIQGVNSFFFEQHPCVTDYDLAISFGISCSNASIRHTLFRLNPNMDVKTVAKGYGGDGHPGVAGFVSTQLELAYTKHQGSPVEVSELVDLLGPEEQLDCVRLFIRLNYLVHPYQAKSAWYNGKRALVANTPYLTREFLFSQVTKYDEELCVSFCMNGQGLYRVAVTTIVGTDPGEEYGELIGESYRVSIIPYLNLLTHVEFSQDVFHGIADGCSNKEVD